ncbi:7538_t:CDS:2, partial [Dentiscutata erythropus]
VEVPKNGNVGINKMNELEKRKNYTYLNNEIEDIRFMRFEGNNKYMKSIQRRGGNAKIHKPRAKRKVNVSSSEAVNNGCIRNLKCAENGGLYERHDLGLCNRNRMGRAVINQVDHCTTKESGDSIDVNEKKSNNLLILSEKIIQRKQAEEIARRNEHGEKVCNKAAKNDQREYFEAMVTQNGINDKNKGVVTMCTINSDEKEIDESDGKNMMKPENIDDVDEAVKRVKVNGGFARTSIRLSSNVNKISMEYVKKKRHAWKCINKGTSGHNEFVGYVPELEVDVNGVKVVQKFYVKHGLTSDVILGMPWITKTREDKFVDVRCVKGELIKDDHVNGEEEKKRIVNKKKNFDESKQIGKIKDESIPD